MRTYVWVPKRDTVYEIESSPVLDAFTGVAPVHSFLAALADSADGRPPSPPQLLP